MAAVGGKEVRVDPGQLRQVIIIEQRGTVTRSASGAVSYAWSTFATVRASIERLGGSEQLGPGSFQVQAAHQITIRYLAGLDSTMRVNFNGRYFDILDIDNVWERNRVHILQVREGKSHGNQ